MALKNAQSMPSSLLFCLLTHNPILFETETMNEIFEPVTHPHNVTFV